MITIVNAWGGEGILSANALYVIGALGMLNGIFSENKCLHLRVLDLDNSRGTTTTDFNRLLEWKKTYEEYYDLVYRDRRGKIVFDNISIDDVLPGRTSSSVNEKFGYSPFLSIGCSKEDNVLRN